MKKLFGQVQIILNDETLEVIREGVVVYKDGKPLKRDITRFHITCNVQPLNARDLLLVPEGDRYKEQLYLYTNQVEKRLRDNDRVLRDGVQWQVQSIEDWDSYTRARIVRIDVGPNDGKP